MQHVYDSKISVFCHWLAKNSHKCSNSRYSQMWKWNKLEYNGALSQKWIKWEKNKIGRESFKETLNKVMMIDFFVCSICETKRFERFVVFVVWIVSNNLENAYWLSVTELKMQSNAVFCFVKKFWRPKLCIWL